MPQLRSRKTTLTDASILRTEENTLDFLDRLFEDLVRMTWEELNEKLGGNRETPEYSGIHPLNSPALLPYLDKPGVFILVGPPPLYQVLYLGSSQAPMCRALSARATESQDENPPCRGVTPPKEVSTYVACISMEEEWTLVRPLRTMLGKRIRVEYDDLAH